MKREWGPWTQRHFTEPITINLSNQFKVKYCLFEEEAKINFEKEGVVEYCKFKKDVTLKTKHHENSQNRKFQHNITHGQIHITGGITIENNFDAIKRVVRGSEQKKKAS